MRELRAAMRALGFQVKKDEMKRMLDDVDKDGYSEINLDEFTKMMTGKMVPFCFRGSYYSLIPFFLSIGHTRHTRGDSKSFSIIRCGQLWIYNGKESEANLQ